MHTAAPHGFHADAKEPVPSQGGTAPVSTFLLYLITAHRSSQPQIHVLLSTDNCRLQRGSHRRAGPSGTMRKKEKWSPQDTADSNFNSSQKFPPLTESFRSQKKKKSIHDQWQVFIGESPLQRQITGVSCQASNTSLQSTHFLLPLS